LQYALFTNVLISPGDRVTITMQPGVYGRALIAGMQIAAAWSPSVDTEADGLSDLTEHLLGLNPNIADTNPQVRLASWHFNTPDWLGDQGQTPLINSNLTTSFVNGLEGGAGRVESETEPQ